METLLGKALFWFIRERIIRIWKIIVRRISLKKKLINLSKQKELYFIISQGKATGFRAGVLSNFLKRNLRKVKGDWNFSGKISSRGIWGSTLLINKKI